MPTRYDTRSDSGGETAYTKGVETRYNTRVSSNGGHYEPERRSASRGYSSSDRYGTADRSVERTETYQQDRQRFDQEEWEKTTVVLEKASKDQSFGIAVSGGRDNPRLESGDTAIVVSDVLLGSPADGLLKIDDVILSVNKQSVENETHAFAVKCLKESGRTVKLGIKRRVLKQSPSREVVQKQTTREGTEEIRYSGKQAPPYRSPPPHVVKTEEYSYKGNDYPQETHTQVITETRETREYSKPPEYRAASHEYRAASHASETRDSPRNAAPTHQTPREEAPKASYKQQVRGDDEPVLVTLERQNLEPYGISLGCQHFIQDVDQLGPAAREGSLEPGDVILKINGINTNELSPVAAVKEVRSSTNVLRLLVQKKTPIKSWVQSEEVDGPALPPRLYDEQQVTVISKGKGDAHLPDEDIESEKKLKTKGLYEKAQAAALEAGTQEDLDNLNSFKEDNYEIHQSWRSPGASSNIPQEEVPPRGDQDVSSSSYTKGYAPSASDSPRSSRSGGGGGGTMDRKDKRMRVGDARLVTFKKGDSLGIQVAGGNQCGIFVAGVKQGSPAQLAGITKGDQIIMANDVELKNFTREEAVLMLISMNEDCNLLVQHRRTAFEKICDQPGDSFYVKSHFDYTAFDDTELTLKKGDVLHVWDTMHDGVVGKWMAQPVLRSGAEGKYGVIPNKNRATLLHGMEDTCKKVAALGKTPTSSMKRKSTLKKDPAKKFISLDELEKTFAEEEKTSNVPAYEKVNLKECTFKRPVVLLGPIADIARDRLLKEEPENFALPEAIRDNNESAGAPRRGISYKSIKDVIDADKHCLLDVTPEAVDKINYAKLCPIVIYFKVPTVKAIKEIRERLLGGKQPNKLIKRLHGSAQVLEKDYTHIFSSTIPVSPTSVSWNKKVSDTIKKLQEDAVWMSADEVDEQEEMIFSQRRSFYSVSEFDSTVDSLAVDSSTIRSSTDEPYPEEHPPEPPTREAASYHTDDDVFTERSDDRYDSKDRWFDDRDRHPDEDQINARLQDTRDRDYGRQAPYDERDGYEIRPPYDDYDRREPVESFQRYTQREEYIEGPSRPGYKPTGHIVKVLPSRENPQEIQELRRSLRKTKPDDWQDNLQSDLEKATDGLRPVERVERDLGPNELEMEIKQKATSLRRVEPESDVFKEYNQRVGMDVSELWRIDNDYRRSYKPAPPEGDGYREREPSRPPRNTIIDTRVEDQEVVPETKYMQTMSYPTYTRYETEPTRDRYVERETVTTTYQRRYEPEQLVRDQDSRDGTPPPQRPMEEVKQKTQERESAPRFVSRLSMTKTSGRDSPQEQQRDIQSTSYRGSLPQPYRSSNTNHHEYNRSFTQQTITKTSSYLTNTELNNNDDDDTEEQHSINSGNESGEGEHQVIATAKGIFGHKGGELISRESGVSIFIPEGAIPKSVQQEIYFKVCKESNNLLPPLDADKGETLLSPLVMCGPHGTTFLKPVELRLPHCASMSPDGYQLALKSSDAQSGEGGPQWNDMTLKQDQGNQCQVGSDSVSVLVDHFSWFGITGYPIQEEAWI